MSDVAFVPAERDRHPHRSLRGRALAAALRCTIKPTLTAWSFVPQMIWPSHVLDRVAEHLPPAPGTHLDRVHLRSCGAEWISAGPDVRDDAAVLYLHGGALVTCSLATHRRLVTDVSRACGAPALSVDFRMMPRVTIEHMVADCLDGYRWLLDRGLPGDRIVIAGDSAGGYLAFLTALAARDEGLPTPAALTCMSPLLDLNTDRKAAGSDRGRRGHLPPVCRLWPGGDDVFTVRTCEGLARYAAAVDDAHEVVGRRIDPIDADLRGLPPTLIQIGSSEILRVDAEEMADRLAAAGVPTRLQVWRGQVHVFQAAAGLVPEARRAIADLGAFARAHLEPAGAEADDCADPRASGIIGG